MRLLLLPALLAATSCSTVKVLPPSPQDVGVHHPLVVKNGGAEVWPAQAQPGAPRGLLFRAQGHAHATVLCLHGIQTHAGWFAPLAGELTARGINVIAIDRRGSGMNTCTFPPGDADSAQQLLDDLGHQMQEAARLGVPVYLAGTSWGSNVASVYVLRHQGTQPSGLIQVVPATKSFFEPFYMTHIFAPLANLIAPEARRKAPFSPKHYQAGNLQPDVRTGLPPDPCAGHSKAVVYHEHRELTRLLRQDTCKHVLVETPTVRLIHSGLELGHEWRTGKKQISPPMLLIVADRDQIMNNHEAWRAAKAHTDATPHQLDIKPLHDAGHGAQITHTHQMARIISLWINQVQSTARS